MRTILLLTSLLVALTLLAAQCGVAPASSPGSDPKISVVDPWARPSPMIAGNGAVYLTLKNEGGSADKLISAKTDVAEVVELHETKIENEVMKMSPLPSVEAPAGGAVSLKPGGKHLMLINLKQELKPGQKISLTLTFEKSGPITVEAEVREDTGMESMEHNK